MASANIPKEIKKDRKLYTHIRSHGPMDIGTWKRPAHPFHSLIRSIIYQQVSGKAAASILKKFKALFPASSKASQGRRHGRFPTPEELLEIPTQKLRGAGLSGQKALYVKDLAAHFVSGEIKHRHLKKWTNDEIIEHLTRVKGIGVWTVHMFLIFTLKRPDVLPTLDLAIRKGFQVVYGLKKEPTHDEMERLASPRRMHASLVSLYLWEASTKLKKSAKR